MLSRELQGMALWDRHKWLVNMYQDSPARGKPSLRTDMDVLREHHQFIREDGGSVAADAPWEERLAAKYYQTIIKEYAVVDLSRYKEMKVGLRWRTEQEVISGKGQFECASLTCSECHALQSFEVPFSYNEQGAAKQALVKVRVCEECTPKLYWKKTKELKKLAKIVAARTTDAESPGVVSAAAQGARPGQDDCSDQRQCRSKRQERVSKRNRHQQDDKRLTPPNHHIDERSVSKLDYSAGCSEEHSKKRRHDGSEGDEEKKQNEVKQSDEADKLLQELLL